jgi:hypothetical protein
MTIFGVTVDGLSATVDALTPILATVRADEDARRHDGTCPTCGRASPVAAA